MEITLYVIYKILKSNNGKINKYKLYLLYLFIEKYFLKERGKTLSRDFFVMTRKGPIPLFMHMIVDNMYIESPKSLHKKNIDLLQEMFVAKNDIVRLKDKNKKIEWRFEGNNGPLIDEVLNRFGKLSFRELTKVKNTFGPCFRTGGSEEFTAGNFYTPTNYHLLDGMEGQDPFFNATNDKIMEIYLYNRDKGQVDF